VVFFIELASLGRPAKGGRGLCHDVIFSPQFGRAFDDRGQFPGKSHFAGGEASDWGQVLFVEGSTNKT
jgi:hypothetical protein